MSWITALVMLVVATRCPWVLIPGDGIGPEVPVVFRRTFEAVRGSALMSPALDRILA